MKLELVNHERAELVPIGLSWLNSAEEAWLRKALAASENPGSFVDLVRRVGAGRTTLYRIIGGGVTGIMAGEVLETPTGPIFYVWLLGGQKILFNLRELYLVLAELALSFDCKRILANATPALAKIYQKKLGFKLSSCEVVKEI